jgi:hypothetical protein
VAAAAALSTRLRSTELFIGELSSARERRRDKSPVQFPGRLPAHVRVLPSPLSALSLPSSLVYILTIQAKAKNEGINEGEKKTSLLLDQIQFTAAK